MATTQEYIEQLKIDKQTLVDNLVEQGVEATSEETFTTLVPKVKDIQSGGDLSEYFPNPIVNTNKKNQQTVNRMYILMKKIPPLNITGSTSLSYFFFGMANLEEIEGIKDYDTSLVEEMSFIFYNIPKILSLDLSKWDTKNLLDVNYCFSANNLKTLDISGWDFQKCYRTDTMFNCPALENLNFGKNFGAGFNTYNSANYARHTLDLSKSPLLTEESLISVLNGLADIASLGVKTQQCILGETNLAKLTSEAGQQALAQAQAYGWTVS